MPANGSPTPQHEITLKKWLAAVLATFKRSLRTDNLEGDLVFFVHGYNNTVANVAARHRLIEKGLAKAGQKCTIITFDWPSGDTPLGYLEDRHDAKETAFRLVQNGIRLFLKAQTKDCAVNIHVIAHSMGAYIVREAFDDADDTTAAKQELDREPDCICRRRYLLVLAGCGQCLVGEPLPALLPAHQLLRLS